MLLTLHIYKQCPSLFPDVFPDPCRQSTSTRQSEKTNVQRPPPSPPDPVARASRSDGEEAQRHEDNTRPPSLLASIPDARDSWTDSGDEMDIASGDGAEGGRGSEGGSDKGGNQDTESEREDTSFRDYIIEKVKNAECSTLTLNLLKHDDRNISFQKVVLDRRGRCVPTLVCISNDVILIMNTGTFEKDILFLERRSTGTRHGDDLKRSCTLWPDIDRGGEYKDSIDELENDLLWVMDITRSFLSEK